MRLLVACGMLVAMLSVPSTVDAHPGHDHKIMGTIVSIDGKHILFKSGNGHELSFEITDMTKLVRGKKPGQAADLKVGMRLVVNVGEGEEPLRAKDIQYSASAAAKATK